MVQCGNACNIDFINVEVLDAAGLWQSCSQISYASSDPVQYSTCTNIGGMTVRLTLLMPSYVTLGSEINYICKIAVFGQGCSLMTPVVTSTTFTVTAFEFDLLVDTMVPVTLPVLTSTPAGCFTVTWRAY